MNKILVRSVTNKVQLNICSGSCSKNALKYLIVTMSCAVFSLLSGCGQQDQDAEQVEVIDTGTGSQTVSTEVVTQAARKNLDSSSEKVINSAGTYRLQVDQGSLTLNSREASRIAIIEDLATQLEIELIKRGEIDSLVSLDLESVSMVELLDNLFYNIPYVAGYAKSVNSRGFRVKHLVLGSSSLGATASAGEQGANTELSSVVGLPQASGELFLGSEPEEVELAQRLQFGSAEDRAIAVSELMMDPAGFDAAYQIFSRDDSPEVRLAVLELIESEDYFVARQMVVASLQDPNKDIVLYALGIVDSLGDFSLVPQVEALMSHYDPEVAAYAQEVRESLTEGYFDPNE
jgi:hypothetical protein